VTDEARTVTWTDTERKIMGGSSKARTPDGVDLVEVANPNR